MNFKNNKCWEIKILRWKLYAEMICNKFLIFTCKCPPFSCFFYTLHYFKIDEIYKENLERQKQKTPRLNKGIKKEVLKKSAIKYTEDLTRKMIESKKEADIATERTNQIKAKLAQFKQLLQNVDAVKRQEYSERINELFNSNDFDSSCERILQYIDSIFEKHAK